MRYTGRHHDVLRYVCHRGRLDNREPSCIAFGGLRVGGTIGTEVLRVLEPCALEAARYTARLTQFNHLLHKFYAPKYQGAGSGRDHMIYDP